MSNGTYGGVLLLGGTTFSYEDGLTIESSDPSHPGLMLMGDALVEGPAADTPLQGLEIRGLEVLLGSGSITPTIRTVTSLGVPRACRTLFATSSVTSSRSLAIVSGGSTLSRSMSECLAVIGESGRLGRCRFTSACAPVGSPGRASSEVWSARARRAYCACDGRCNRQPALAFGAPVRDNGRVDPQHGNAEEAGEQMHSELDAIQARLRALKRELDARESVVELDEETVASAPRVTTPGDVV